MPPVHPPPGFLLGVADPHRRYREHCLRRYRALLDAVPAARDRYNALLRARADDAPVAAARAAFDEAWNATFPAIMAPLGTPPGAVHPDVARSALEHAVVYLRWEAEYPEEWRRHHLWSAWQVKSSVLATLSCSEIPDWATEPLTDLLFGALRRRYRCEDWSYTALARRLDRPRLRDRLAAESADPSAAERLSFLRWLLDRPDVTVTDGTWRRWRSRPDR